ncbi:hypothetical protein KKA13_01910 [Patescibacteria group bacterium]|nr:hypothetical protein [Patescibacteria group bacterium]
MTLRQYLILMTIGTFLCAFCWVFVMFSFDPTRSGMLGLLFFYISLFFTLVGAFSVLGFLLRRIVIRDDEIIFRHVRRTFRQAVFISCFAITVLLFLQFRLLNWWVAIILGLMYAILEGIIFTNRKHSNADYVSKFY